MLSGGDVLALGSEANPPTIELDAASIPAGYVTVAPPGEIPGEMVAARVGGEAVAVAGPTAMQRRRRRWRGMRRTPMAMMRAGRDAAPTRFYVPRRRRASDALVVVAVVATISIIGGVAIFVYTRRPQTPDKVEVVTATPAVGVRATASSKPVARSMFNDAPQRPPVETYEYLAPDDQASTADAPAPATRESPAIPTSRISPAIPAAPESDADKAFKGVESAYYNPNPAKALLAIDAYAERHPNAHKAQIEQYRADMLDKIWWERIDSLFEKRKELTAAVKKIEKDIKDETEEAFKKTVLQPRLEEQKRRLEAIGVKLTQDMAYTLPTPPPIGRDAEMSALRDKRNRAVFDMWSKRVLKHIRDNHGAYPWANEK